MKLGISGKLALSLIAAAVGVVALASAMRYHADRLAMEIELHRTMDTILNRLAISLERSIEEGASRTIDATLLAEFNNEDVAALVVWRWRPGRDPSLISAPTRSGTQRPEFLRTEPDDPSLLSRRQTLYRRHQTEGLMPVGEVVVFLDPAPAKRRLAASVLKTVLETTLIVGLLAVLLAWVANRYVVRPLTELGKAIVTLESAQAGEFGDLALIDTSPIPPDSPAFAELRRIGQQFTHMAEAINSRQLALHESEEKYRTLLENLPQRIFLKDENLVYLSCNENYARDLHLQPEQIVGRTDRDFYPKRVSEEYLAYDEAVLAEGRAIYRNETYIIRGQRHSVRTTRLPLQDSSGHVWGILGIFDPIGDSNDASPSDGPA